MSFANQIKKLANFLKEQGFLAVPMNHRKYRSWVKELDSEHLVYMYVYINQYKEESQSGHLIISPPRNNDDLWENSPLAIGIPLAENWELGSDYFDDYINRLTNLLPSAVYLKDAVICEMNNPSNISTNNTDARNLGLRQLIEIKAFHRLKQEPNFNELCALSKEAWFKQKEIYSLDIELGQKCYTDCGDEIAFKYIDDYTGYLSMILATYSAFK